MSIYYGTLSDIRVKIYCHLNFLRASVFNLVRLDMLLDSIGHPCIKLLSFEFSTSFCFNFEHLDILWDTIGHPSIKLLSLEIAQSFCYQF